MQLKKFISNKSDRSQAKKWLKTLKLACSYAGLSGKKSLWDLADLAGKVETEWGNHPNYHLKALSDACGISESRLMFKRHKLLSDIALKMNQTGSPK